MTNPDIITDFETCVDNLVPIKLTIRDTGTIYRIDHAHRNQVPVTAHTPANGEIRQGDTIWQFPIVESVDPIPLGSTIQLDPDVIDPCISDSEVWTILAIAKQIWSSKWEARCRNLSIDANLNTLVDILSATYVADSDGEPIPTWSLFAANIRAKFQLTTRTSEVSNMADDSDQLYDVTLAAQPTFEPGLDYRLVDSFGQIYGILGTVQEARIDVLPIIRCRVLHGYSSSGA